MHYVIVDLEATCWQRSHDRLRMEIIEIGAVRLASSQGPVVAEFSSFVRPVAEPRLSEFCTQLTTITQRDVDAADPFPVVFARFLAWVGPDPFVLCSWGGYDLKQFRQDCRRHGIEMPSTFERHINLKQAFAQVRLVKTCPMERALAIEKLRLEGTHHRGIDDARNLARIATRILPVLESRTESSPDSFLDG